jgi:signal transduction histidine kinase
MKNDVKGNKILVVDDEEPIGRILGSVLKRMGQKHSLAQSAEEARRLLETETFDLVLCDIRLPGESGMSLIQHILSDYPDTAVIMVTGVDDPETVEKALQVGAYGYIIKPFNTSEVMINISSALRRKSVELWNRIYRESLEKKVAERTRDLEQELAERMRAEKELEGSREGLRRLSAHLLLSREQERASIARDIHDDLGQVLTALKMDLFWLKSNLPEDGPQNFRKKISDMSFLIQNTSKTLKRICSELRPDLLEEFGLAAAMQWYAEEFQKRFGIHCLFEFDKEEVAVGKEKATALFRIFQEGLNNVARHSKATEVRVTLEEKGETLCLMVRDNGVGFDPKAHAGRESFGILGMRERTHILDGEFHLEASPGRGTLVKVKIPMDEGETGS